MPHTDADAIRREIDSVAWRGQTTRQRLAAKDSPHPADASTARKPTRKLDLPSALDLMDEQLVQDLAGRGGDLTTTQHGCWTPSSSTAHTDSFSAVESMRTDHTSLDAAVARITQLEKMLRAQELELRLQKEENTEHQEQIKRLHAQNLAMHDFLSDYDMRWVGSDSRGGSRASSLAPSRGASRPASGAMSSRSSSRPVSGRGSSRPDACSAAVPNIDRFHLAPNMDQVLLAPNMDRVRQAVLELNEIAGGGSRVIRRQDGPHGLQVRRSLASIPSSPTPHPPVPCFAT
jgi:hypothetical protein